MRFKPFFLVFYQDEVERSAPVLSAIGHRRAKHIDNVSRIVFPASFTIFCGFYWIYYVM